MTQNQAGNHVGDLFRRYVMASGCILPVLALLMVVVEQFNDAQGELVDPAPTAQAGGAAANDDRPSVVLSPGTSGPWVDPGPSYGAGELAMGSNEDSLRASVVSVDGSTLDCIALLNARRSRQALRAAERLLPDELTVGPFTAFQLPTTTTTTTTSTSTTSTSSSTTSVVAAGSGSGPTTQHAPASSSAPAPTSQPAVSKPAPTTGSDQQTAAGPVRPAPTGSSGTTAQAPATKSSAPAPVKPINPSQSIEIAQAESPTTIQPTGDHWYIPNRAGSVDKSQEASGLVASRRYPGVYWFIRDSAAKSTSLYAIRIDPATGKLTDLGGTRVREIPVSGVENTDWEALTLDTSGTLWIGDVGDYWNRRAQDRNHTAAPDARLFGVPEPDPYRAGTATSIHTVTISYPDGIAHNVEAIFMVGDHLYLAPGSTTGYVFRLPDGWRQTSQVTAVALGTMAARLDYLTGAEMSADLSTLALTTQDETVVVYQRAPAIARTSAEADAIVRAMLITGVPKYHYFYRSAGALAADGDLDRQRPDPGPGGEYRETGLSIQSVAFGPGLELAMLAEYGQHVLYVPPTSADPHGGWTQRPGSG